MTWGFRKTIKQPPESLYGYTVIAEGNDHICGLPDPRRFAEGAVIQCDDCGKRAELLYNGFVGKYWSGAMVHA